MIQLIFGSVSHSRKKEEKKKILIQKEMKLTPQIELI